ncbi:uncharacterized protein LOC129001517 [Macrosteles quadrilineatus]|uniref:uncharacterized protein LOC129001517 n=1 Tax=Macrosteles quadrilineatus TaxID=74068 RepID=UPI0023E30AB8|nr:uncharacterized protein LOC129001517 [Macrosteles quadrilineatus]
MKVLLISAALVAAALCAAPAPPAGWTPSGRLLLVPARLEAYPPPAEYPQTTVQPETNQTHVAQESESDESQSGKLLESGEYYVLLPDGRLQMVKYATAALKSGETDSKDAKNEQTQNNPAEQFQNAYYIQAQEEQKQEQPAQYNNAPYKFQPAAYPVFIRPQESDSSRYTAENSQNFQNFQKFQKPEESKFQQVKEEPNYQIDFVQFPLQGAQQFSQTKLQLSEVKSEQTKAEEKEEASGFEANLQYREVKPISAPIYAYNPTPLVRILKK